MLKNKGNVIRD